MNMLRKVMGVIVPPDVEVVDKQGRIIEKSEGLFIFTGFNHNFQDCGKTKRIYNINGGTPLHALFFQPNYPNTYVICLTPIGLVTVFIDNIEFCNE